MGLIEDVHMWLPQITTRATVLVITLLYIWNMYAYKILILIHMLSNCNIYIQDHLHNIMEFSVCTRQHFDVWLIYLAVLIVINHDAMYWLYLKLSFFEKMFPPISKSNTGRWNFDMGTRKSILSYSHHKTNVGFILLTGVCAIKIKSNVHVYQ